MIPYGRQHISAEDIEAVVSVLRSAYLTQGPAVPEFEQRVAQYCGARHGIAVNSATSALHIACLAAGVQANDSVWTSAITFVATANCARYCGAEVDFVDIDPRTYNMSSGCLEEKLERADKTGRLPKAVIAVHLCGQPCDMAGIHALAGRFGFTVIEDASHAIGARYRSEPTGNCRYSDITVFSFHPVKVITTGEGGMAVTNSDELAERMRLLRSHGTTRNASQMTHSPDGPWYYQQIELGFNYRMTDFQAALGSSQLRRLDEFVARRHEIAARYDTLLDGLPVVTPWQDPQCWSARHLYVIRLRLAEIGRTHRAVFEAMRTAGIGVNLHYIPLHLQPYHQRSGSGNDRLLPEAERYYAEAISLPIYPGLSEDEQSFVCRALGESMAGR